MSMYRFIEAEKAGERSVNRAGAVLEVSRAADDEWRHQQPSRRAQEDQELTEKVRTIFTSSRQTYGAPRVHRTLRQAGPGARASGWPGRWASSSSRAGTVGAGSGPRWPTRRR